MTDAQPAAGKTTPEITREILDQLIKLAQFDLTPQRKDYLQRELNKQREALEKIDEAIAEIEAADLDPAMMTHATVFTETNRSPLREDIVRPFEDNEALLDNAPRIKDRHFAVPRRYSKEQE